MRLPSIPPALEWVITAHEDRTTVTLSHSVPEEYKPSNSGFIMHHTIKHNIHITRENWEREVVEAAESVLERFESSKTHASWADQLMRGAE